ncbi:MAG: glycine zipper 2TM domain-containing protein [Xanthomonadales bacterium]|jgi:uncharacterized protein YcfJ|nr:glycine zipper 2TM domain-containing protein [Xanthomonadales bacterium]
MRVATALLLSVVGLSSLALSPAAAAQSQYAWARVIDAQPIYDEVEVPGQTRRECRQQPLAYDDRYAYHDDYADDYYDDYEPRGRHRSDAGVVFGAILGGVIGNQFGSGSGRTAATVAGAALGSAIASDSQRQRYYNDRDRRDYRRPAAFAHAGAVEEICETTREYHREQQIRGYEVTWDYNGQVGYSRTRSHPGDQIQVEVHVRALED